MTKKSPRAKSTPASKPSAKAKPSAAAATCVALLRGINVGGKNKLAMADLAALCTDLGCRDVRTYIQSGNVVFTASAALQRRFAAELQAKIAARLGLHVPVILRTAAELRAVAADNPYLRAGAAPETLYVGFLADAPTAAQVASLDPQRSPGDAFCVVGRDVYQSLGNGAADTKLTSAWFDRLLGTTITVRNWRTVLQLVAMADGAG